MKKIEKQDGGDKLDFVIAVYNGSNMAYHKYNKIDDCMGPAEELTVQSLRRLFKFVKSQKNESYNFGKNIIPPNIISFKTDEKFVSWWTKPCKKHLLFKKDVITSGDYPLPYLLWKLKGNSLYVFALKSKPKNGLATVYQAPFMNVNSEGSVCMGSAKFSCISLNYNEIISKVENAFFNSYFTHTNANELLNGNFVELMNEMKDKDVFKNELLISKKKNINHYINGR